MTDDRGHHFLALRKEKPFVVETNRLAAYIINALLGKNYSIFKWRKLKEINIEWRTNVKKFQGTITLDKLSEHLQSKRQLLETELTLPKIECEWLDGFVSFSKPDGPIATINYDQFARFTVPMDLGHRFPLNPCIDREGVVYRTLQTPLQQNIIGLYYKLVENSHLAIGLDFNWLNDFRMLLNDCVAVIDVTLYQLYFKAQFGDYPNLFKFDEEVLGSRFGRRLKDKLNWIGKITGRPLDNAFNEVSSFTVLKNLRNHLSHFDPPCFAYTMEDVASWLNRVSDVGRLLWRIREKIQVQLNSSIISIILLPPVDFVPKNQHPRVPQPKDVGYGSTDWSRISSDK
ncbi:MAG: hypothetical protein ABII93_07805 [Chrysiogenia bacterium]